MTYNVFSGTLNPTQSIINQSVHTSVSVTYTTYNNRDTTSDLTLLFGQIELEMWANAQRDGRPAEYRWRPLFNATKFGLLPLLDAVQ